MADGRSGVRVPGYRAIFDTPDLVVLGARDAADPGELMSRRVLSVEYEHLEDPVDVARYHDFREGVRMVALPGRHAVLLVGTRPIWRDVG